MIHWARFRAIVNRDPPSLEPEQEKHSFFHVRVKARAFAEGHWSELLEGSAEGVRSGNAQRVLVKVYKAPPASASPQSNHERRESFARFHRVRAFRPAPRLSCQPHPPTCPHGSLHLEARPPAHEQKAGVTT